MHGLTEKRAPLCISGGGIRSATFGLGVLQGLARCGLRPHENTADQFFSESQFESYRMLGAHTMEMICPTETADFESFIKGVGNYLAQSDSDRTENPNAPRN